MRILSVGLICIIIAVGWFCAGYTVAKKTTDRQRQLYYDVSKELHECEVSLDEFLQTTKRK